MLSSKHSRFQRAGRFNGLLCSLSFKISSIFRVENRSVNSVKFSCCSLTKNVCPYHLGNNAPGNNFLEMIYPREGHILGIIKRVLFTAGTR